MTSAKLKGGSASIYHGSSIILSTSVIFGSMMEEILTLYGCQSDEAKI